MMIFNLIERVLDHYLQLDPEVFKELAPLSGKVFAIECQGIGNTFYLIPHKKGIHVVGEYLGKPDVTLSGGPFSLLRMGLTSSPDKIIRTSEITIIGDVDSAQKLKGIFDHLEIDWEEKLSHITGDIFAHSIGRFFRMFFNWGKETSENLQQNTSEYLKEELRLLPSREEIADFLTSIDYLRDDVDRLEARLSILLKH